MQHLKLRGKKIELMSKINQWFNDEDVAENLIRPSMKQNRISPDSAAYHKRRRRILAEFFTRAEKQCNDWTLRKRVKKLVSNRNQLEEGDF